MIEKVEDLFERGYRLAAQTQECCSRGEKKGAWKKPSAFTYINSLDTSGITSFSTCASMES
ncbi:MAG TPA: hypothetical protein VFF42_00940 [Candidatus Eremiobacteraceae bacterium]|nr:hypothetical protein [Candidatus Eremiobacteraceae bacterium]